MLSSPVRAVVVAGVAVLLLVALTAWRTARLLLELDASPAQLLELVAAAGVALAAWLFVVRQVVVLAELARLQRTDPDELERRLAAARDQRRADRVARRQLEHLLAEYEALPRQVPVSDEVANHAEQRQAAMLSHAAAVGRRLSAAAPRPVEVITPAELERRLAAGVIVEPPEAHDAALLELQADGLTSRPPLAAVPHLVVTDADVVQLRPLEGTS